MKLKFGKIGLPINDGSMGDLAGSAIGTIPWVVLFGLAIHAQTGIAIHVRGKVTSGGSPVSGATVTLSGKALSATTDAQGAYAITGTGTSLSPSSRSMSAEFSFRNGVLEMGLPGFSAAKVEVFDVGGNLIRKETADRMDAGVYRVDIAGSSRAPGLLFIKATVNGESRAWRYLSFRNSMPAPESRAGDSRAMGGGALAKAAAAVDSLHVSKQGFSTHVVPIESYDAAVDVSLSPGPVAGQAVEDAGYDCKVTGPTGPTGANGGSATVLPDPFTKWDGSRVESMEDWRCRRRELVMEVEKRILGTKAPPPALKGGTVTGTISRTAYTVNVVNPDGQTTFSGAVSVPSTGTAPYPAVIVIGGFNSLNKDVMSSEGVATISYDNNAIAAETAGNFAKGKYFDANPAQKGNTGALVAWAWGVSRIIDMIEKNPGVIDPAKIAVHGCSRLGKAAFVIGAFDQRIAIGIPLEPGTGGPAPLRALPSMGGQTLASANGEASWFGPMSKDYSASMAVDMSDVAAMYAPRGLLMMDNAHIAHLSYKANYLGVAAAREVYKAMGKEDAVWYLGSSGNGSHCAERAEYGDELRAMFRKFFKGEAGAATGGLDKHANHGTLNVDGWTASWKKGAIPQ